MTTIVIELFAQFYMCIEPLPSSFFDFSHSSHYTLGFDFIEKKQTMMLPVLTSLSWGEKCTPQDYGYKTPKYTPSNP